MENVEIAFYKLNYEPSSLSTFIPVFQNIVLMTIQECTNILEDWAPLPYAEDFDNVGLLVGDARQKISGILITLDTLEQTVAEAIEKDCNLIVSFHPIIFKGLKKLTGSSYVERTVLRAIQNNIAIYAIHTALDNCNTGVNDEIANRLGLTQKRILIPQPSTLRKLVTYVPTSHIHRVKVALGEAGAGRIGNYDYCSFSTLGEGNYQPNPTATPFRGTKGEIHSEEEIQLHCVMDKHYERSVIEALLTFHPYEEVAYEITTLNNTNRHRGMGMIGTLAKPENEIEFLERVKSVFGTGCIRHSELLGRQIQKVAVLGGSGSFAIRNAIGAQADVFVTADLKYHDFYQAEHEIILADIGHHESEQFTKNLLHTYLTKKISNFAPALAKGKIFISEENTNPVKYLY